MKGTHIGASELALFKSYEIGLLRIRSLLLDHKVKSKISRMFIHSSGAITSRNSSPTESKESEIAASSLFKLFKKNEMVPSSVSIEKPPPPLSSLSGASLSHPNHQDPAGRGNSGLPRSKANLRSLNLQKEKGFSSLKSCAETGSSSPCPVRTDKSFILILKSYQCKELTISTHSAVGSACKFCIKAKDDEFEHTLRHLFFKK